MRAHAEAAVRVRRRREPRRHDRPRLVHRRPLTATSTGASLRPRRCPHRRRSELSAWSRTFAVAVQAFTSLSANAHGPPSQAPLAWIPQDDRLTKTGSVALHESAHAPPVLLIIPLTVWTAARRPPRAARRRRSLDRTHGGLLVRARRSTPSRPTRPLRSQAIVRRASTERRRLFVVPQPSDGVDRRSRTWQPSIVIRSAPLLNQPFSTSNRGRPCP